MYLRAISTGDAVPHTDFHATVHSVFHSAINLRLTRVPELLTVVSAGQADLPQGIRVESPENFSFEFASSGEQVTCRDDLLRFGSLVIELRGARRWRCDLPALRADMTDPDVATAWRSTWRLLGERQGFSGVEIIAQNLVFSDNTARRGLLRKVEDAVRDLLDATRRYDVTVAPAIGTLVGLGAGLTPSGDDWLVGYLAGLWCAVRSSRRCVQYVSDLAKEVLRFSSNTNDISRTFLYHATRGQVSSLLEALAGAICKGWNEDHLLRTAEAAMRVGSTSGRAAVAGLLLGLAVWSGDHLLNDINRAGLQASPLRALL
jgi:hypothetical protein